MAMFTSYVKLPEGIYRNIDITFFQVGESL